MIVYGERFTLSMASPQVAAGLDLRYSPSYTRAIGDEGHGVERGACKKPMKVKVRFFALYREKLGMSETVVNLKEGETVATLVKVLKEQFPQLASLSLSLIIAVNAEYVDQQSRLKDGDEVALIPPVSGG